MSAIELEIYKMISSKILSIFLLISGCFSEAIRIVDFQKTPHFGKNPYAELWFENVNVSKVAFCINIRLYFKYHKEKL